MQQKAKVCNAKNNCDFINCDSCNSYFHIECIDMNKISYDFYLKNKHVGNSWHCEDCKEKIKTSGNNIKAIGGGVQGQICMFLIL